jgi:hypothetical protein
MPAAQPVATGASFTRPAVVDDHVFQPAGFLSNHIDKPFNEVPFKAQQAALLDRLRANVIQSMWLHHRDVPRSLQLRDLCAQPHAFRNYRDHGGIDLIKTLTTPTDRGADIGRSNSVFFHAESPFLLRYECPEPGNAALFSAT